MVGVSRKKNMAGVGSEEGGVKLVVLLLVIVVYTLEDILPNYLHDASFA